MTQTSIFNHPPKHISVLLLSAVLLFGKSFDHPGLQPASVIIELTEAGNNLLGFGNRLFAQSRIKTDAQIFHWSDKWSQNIVAITITTHMHTLGMEVMILTVLSPTQRSVRLKYSAIVTASNFDKVRYLLRLDSLCHRNPRPGRMVISAVGADDS
jgi:hypothetical protein